MAETPSGKKAERLDADRLGAWMREHVTGFAGPIEIEKYPGGQSNPTYRISTPGRDYVLRRKPPGKLLPGAHAVEREYRVIRVLEDQDFPVPHGHALCEDPAVIGTPFYVMDRVEGRIFWNPRLPEVPAAERSGYYDAMCETIARLHRIDYVQAGLADYGKPGQFLQRQIGLWSRQYAQDEAAGRIDAMDRLVDWLPANIPDDGDPTAIIHGDFRCDNLIFHPDEPRIIAVLDWELSTLGHPLADFAYHLMTYRLPPSLPAGLGGEDLKALGLPSEAEYINAYCRHSGRSSIDNLDFYMAFNMFRLAAIIHGVKGRLLRGNASSDRADQLVGHLGALADAAWGQARRAGA
ncbi:MAG: phosphotransferase family protein [Xanthomonadales bacterium]|nr:phosphotransferase family protein [Xanthomonadales bacterium]